MSQNRPSGATLPLLPYLKSKETQDFKIIVSVLKEGSTFKLEYTLIGNLDEILLPPPKLPVERKDNLWKSTCFEAFITWEKNPGYFELNLSPSGDWNFYSFQGYRLGQKQEDRVKGLTHSVTQSEPGIVVHKVTLDLSEVLKDARPERLLYGLTTVLQKKDGSQSYWAIEHRSLVPDFHVRESFSLVV